MVCYAEINQEAQRLAFQEQVYREMAGYNHPTGRGHSGILATAMNLIPQTITFCQSACCSARAAAALLSLVILAIGLIGCEPSPEEVADGGNPLAALRASVPSTRYDGRFWRLLHRQALDLYTEAIAFCRVESETVRLEERPNCEPVCTSQVEDCGKMMGGEKGRRQSVRLLDRCLIFCGGRAVQVEQIAPGRPSLGWRVTSRSVSEIRTWPSG